jgi:hypothetical protein
MADLKSETVQEAPAEEEVAVYLSIKNDNKQVFIDEALTTKELMQYVGLFVHACLQRTAEANCDCKFCKQAKVDLKALKGVLMKTVTVIPLN